ncbi:glutamine synthetase family protein [Kamptonema formosum]|uniref:glutamine synthetase family protein n=1 Tax=Kamptonema formosum TaxID=331992 RepID=UPI00037F3AE2|nr:glutamine synthetase family protein [Oscillatoria sp. PCC 10802]
MENDLLESLKSASVRFIRVLWCDNANVIRAKAFYIGVLSEHIETGIGISAAQQAIPVMYDAVVPETGLGPVGEVWLVPDWSSLSVLPYAPGHVRVIGDIIKDGETWSLCPRGFLKRMVAEAKNEGLEVMAAFENEFYLLRRTPEGIVPADETVFASTLGMDLNRAVIDEIADDLIAQKMPVERYYPESGPGQHEISIRYSEALQAADRQIAFRETVRAVAIKHGLRASFLPKIFADKAGSGCHLHLSLWRDRQNILPDAAGAGGLSQTARAFIAGILHHLPALMALTTPTSNSYRRIRPHFWSGAFRAWGPDNREAAVRIPSNPAPPSPTHFELKTSDASANPYLALGAVIAAGLDGVRRNLDPGEPVAVDPGYLSEAERSTGRIDRLPAFLGDAIGQLSRNETLLSALGSELARAYLAVRKAEWEAMKDMELEEEVKLLLERY